MIDQHIADVAEFGSGSASAATPGSTPMSVLVDHRGCCAVRIADRGPRHAGIFEVGEEYRAAVRKQFTAAKKAKGSRRCA